MFILGRVTFVRDRSRFENIGCDPIYTAGMDHLVGTLCVRRHTLQAPRCSKMHHHHHKIHTRDRSIQIRNIYINGYPNEKELKIIGFYRILYKILNFMFYMFICTLLLHTVSVGTRCPLVLCTTSKTEMMMRS